MKKYPYLNEAVAHVLTRRRVQLSLSKKKLSEDAGIARIHITHLETGMKSPTMNIIFHLCKALDFKPEDFIHQVQAEMERLEADGAHSPKPLPAGHDNDRRS